MQTNANKTTRVQDVVVTTISDCPASLALDTSSSSRYDLDGNSHMDFNPTFDTNVCIHIFKGKIVPVSSLIETFF